VSRILRFGTVHTWPGLNRSTLEQLRRELRHHPDVRLIRLEASLSAGRLVCVVDAFEPERVPRWFHERGYPIDDVFPIDFEGDHGSIHQVAMFDYVAPGEEPAAAPRAHASRRESGR